MIGLDREGGLRGAAEAAWQRPRTMGRVPGAMRAPQAGDAPAMPTVRGLRDAYEQGEEGRAGVARGLGWLGGLFGDGVPDGAAAPVGAVDVEPLPPLPGVPTAFMVDPVPRFARGGLAAKTMRRARRVGAAGLVHSATPGRADLVGARLRQGSYVLPADVVSGLGQGNTLAGAKILHASLPEAAEMASRGAVSRAAGGMVDDDEIEVKLSGGEYLVSPEQVLAIGEGDMEGGARALDELVASVREHSRAAVDQMAPPK